MTNYEEIFNLFTTDTPLYHFGKPFRIDDMVYASDASSLITMQEDKAGFSADPYPNGDDMDSIAHVIPEENRHIHISIDREELEKHKTKPAMKEEFKKCDICDGNGEVEWTFEEHTMDADCPVCDGRGGVDIEIPVSGEMTFYDFTTMEIYGCEFRLALVERLVKVSALTGQPIVLTTIPEKKPGGYRFQVGDVTIMLMPVIPTDSPVMRIN